MAGIVPPILTNIGLMGGTDLPDYKGKWVSIYTPGTRLALQPEHLASDCGLRLSLNIVVTSPAIGSRSATPQCNTTSAQ